MKPIAKRSAEYKAQRNSQDGANASVATRGIESPPAPTVPEVELSGFSFMTITRPNEAPQSDSMLLLVDSGSLDHYFDDTIIPGLENHMLNVDFLETPRKISTAGNHIMLGTRTGTLPGTVVDKDGRWRSVKIPGVIVSGMERHFFSSKKAVEKGLFTIIDSDLPRLQQDKLLLRLQQRCETLVSTPSS